MAILNDIDSLIAKRHLLTHPFYKAWTDGTLPRTSLQDYARQYYAFESRLPRFLTAMHARCEDAETRKTLLANAWDEEHGDANHPELWLRFAEAIGISRDAVKSATPHPATQALVDCYAEAAANAPIGAGIAALYAYESQLPKVAEAKIDGLAAHYGIKAGSGLSFFETHRAIDVHHAAGERAAIDSAVARDAREDDAMLEWTDRALGAWWGFLDAFPAS